MDDDPSGEGGKRTVRWNVQKKKKNENEDLALFIASSYHQG